MINSNFGFTPLKEVWLGDCYPESFYDHLPNEIADPFRQITEWTKHDLSKLQKYLESLNIIVRRPIFESINNHLDQNNNLMKPPITPRDDYLVLGNTLYSLHNDLPKDPWHHTLSEYKNLGYNVCEPKNSALNFIYPPSLMRIGSDLYVDLDGHEHVWGWTCEWMIELAKNYRVNICSTGGHSDGVFCPVVPGVIVSSHYKKDYSQSFPNWKIFAIPNNLRHNYRYSKNWRTSHANIDSNHAFSAHIQQIAKTWVGDFRETVFEVNMLVIDQHNVVAMKPHDGLAKFLESIGITMHFFDFRTRSFWDGGWHCLTLDIQRDDTKDDLFPERGNNGVYWRLK